MFGINPDGVVIVAARCASDGREAYAGIERTVSRGVRHIDDVFIFRVHPHVGEIIAAAPDARLIIYATPARSRIVRTIESAELWRSLNQRVDKARRTGGNAEYDAA